MMGKQRIVFERKLHRPIVWQIDALPGAIVKPQASNRQEIAGLGKGRLPPSRAIAKIALGISSMTQLEAPAEIQQ